MLDIMQKLKFKREFYSGTDKCKLGCLYCFADIDGFKKLDIVNFHRKDSKNEEVLIYYPSCDTEFIWSDNFDNFIEKMISSNTKSIISISTKGKIRKSLLDKIKITNEILIKENLGFIKFSVSITNKSMIDIVEPKTSKYQERIELLKHLSEQDIPSSVILKPILPFIKTEEYFEIIDDTSAFTDNYLLGGLYVSEKSAFYKEYIENRYEVINKQANWLSYNPMWSFIESSDKISILTNYISTKNKFAFSSDLDLLENMWENVISNKIF